MAEFSAPRPARLDEYPEAMAFTDRVFRPGQKGRRIVESQYPHAYRETAAYARRLLLLRDEDAEGQLVGCLGIHPMKLRLGASVLTAGGIGVVGADPDRRGEGIMTRLLVDAIGRMREAGHTISILGGDRQRYGWFGWENGGVRRRYLLTRRMLGPPDREDVELELKRFDAGNAAMRRRLHRLSTGRSIGVEHTAADVGPLFDRVGRETWIIEQGRQIACLSLAGPNRRNRPYQQVHAAFGDPQLVASALRLLMKRFRRQQLWAVAGPTAEEAALFEPWSCQWVTEDDGMIRILDLPRLVEQLEPELARCRRVSGVRAPDLQLQLTDLNQSAVLKGAGGGKRKIRLTCTEAVRLLFGSGTLSSCDLAQRLPESVIGPWSALLPLPLHVPPLHHI